MSRLQLESYLNQEVQNDAAATPPNLPLASCDLDLWPPDPKVDHSCPWPVGHLSQLTSKSVNSFLKNIVFRSLATDERLTEGMNRHWQVENIFMPVPARLAWHRHIVYNMQNNSTKKGLISITIPDVYTVKKKSTFNWTRKPTRPNRVVRPPNLPSALCDLDL